RAGQGVGDLVNQFAKRRIAGAFDPGRLAGLEAVAMNLLGLQEPDYGDSQRARHQQRAGQSCLPHRLPPAPFGMRPAQKWRRVLPKALALRKCNPQLQACGDWKIWEVNSWQASPLAT